MINLKSNFHYFLIGLWALSLRFFTTLTPNTHEQKIAQFYILGWTIFLAATFFLSKYLPTIKWKFLPTLLCLLPILGTEPLFENDQYRYLWEGKVMSAGFNPYKAPPASPILDDINFPERPLVGYNKLTSPYSPLTVAFFSLFSPLTYTQAVFVIQLLNCLFVALILHYLQGIKTLASLPIMGIFCKEFSQSIHMELLAVVPLLLAIVFLEKKKTNLSYLFFMISTLFKINGFLLFPWFLGRAYQEGKIRAAIPWLLIMFASLFINFFGPLSLHESNGFYNFMKHWTWHPGALSIFLTVFEMKTARILTDVLWILTLCGLGLTFLRHRWQGFKAAYFIFILTAFLRPTFNSWYTAWFLLPGATFNSFGSLWYGFFSELSYVNYATSKVGLYWFSVLVTHFGIVFVVKELFKNLKTIQRNIS